ncbi:MAG: alanine racemase [Thermoleophilia bacterium]|nr:alanine racemase [Thermoleophilia bacterium]
MYRARATVDLAAVRRNIAAIRGRLSPHAACIAVVKADGYGHGAVPVAQAALQAGAMGLAVTTCEEACSLHDAGLARGALVMGPVLDEQVEEAVKTGAAFALWSPEFVRSVGRVAARMQTRVGLHLKVDTGMHRLGAAPAEVPALVEAVAAHPWLELTAVMTHLACADVDPEFTRSQLGVFRRTIEPVRRAWPQVRYHAANSAATLGHPSSHFDLVRCGIAVYGLSPFQHDPAGDGLSPALSLSSFVATVRDLEPGDGVSYSLTWKAARRTRVALVPIGYGDGFFRALSNKGDVLIGGKRYARVGTVCMDQFLVEVGRDAPVRFGDPVVLIGEQGSERITAEELAAHAGTINYEITCSLTARVQREYVGVPSHTDELEDHG